MTTFTDDLLGSYLSQKEFREDIPGDSQVENLFTSDIVGRYRSVLTQFEDTLFAGAGVEKIFSEDLSARYRAAGTAIYQLARDVEEPPQFEPYEEDFAEDVITGGQWVNTQGTFVYSSGKLTAPAGNARIVWSEKGIQSGPVTVRAKVKFSAANRYIGPGVAMIADTQIYWCYMRTTEIAIQRRYGGTTTLINQVLSLSTGVWYWIEFYFDPASGALKAKYWVDGAAVPSSWLLETTDANLKSGYVGLMGYEAGSECTEYSLDNVEEFTSLPHEVALAPGYSHYFALRIKDQYGAFTGLKSWSHEIDGDGDEVIRPGAPDGAIMTPAESGSVRIVAFYSGSDATKWLIYITDDGDDPDPDIDVPVEVTVDPLNRGILNWQSDPYGDGATIKAIVRMKGTEESLNTNIITTQAVATGPAQPGAGVVMIGKNRAEYQKED